MAFLLQIYADNLISASKPPTRVRADTAQVAREMYELVGACELRGAIGDALRTGLDQAVDSASCLRNPS
jgi:hypothetical protein